MPTFDYEAHRPDGTVVLDDVMADSVQQAIAQLAAQSLTVTRISLRPESPVTPAPQTTAEPIHLDEVKARLLAMRQSRPAIAHGLRAYAAEWIGGSKLRYFVKAAKAIDGVCEKSDSTIESFDQKRLLALAAEYHNDVSTPELLGRLIQQAHNQLDQAHILLRSLRYPLFLVLVAFAILVAFRFTLATPFQQLLGDFETTLPPITVVFFYLCDYWLLALVSFALAMAAIRFVVPRLLPQMFVDRIPILGKLLRTTALTQFLYDLSGLISMELPPADAVRIAGNSNQRAVLRKAANNWAQAFLAAGTGSPIIDRTGEIPATLSFALQQEGAGRDKAQFVLELARSQQMRHGDARRDMMTLSEPAAIIFIGGLIAAMFVALFAPLFRMMEVLS